MLEFILLENGEVLDLELGTPTGLEDFSNSTASITNYNPNPSFETDISGWSALPGASVQQDDALALWGQNSLQVFTDGLNIGEGVQGPPAQFLASGSLVATLSAYLYTTDPSGPILIFNAVSALTRNLLASGVVTVPAGQWVRVSLPNFAVPNGDTYYLTISTLNAQSTTFWIDGVQYEFAVTTASKYVDGDQLGGTWTGEQGLSPSYQAVSNPDAAGGGLKLSGTITPVAWHQQQPTSASGGMTLSHSTLTLTVSSPPGAFKDFGAWSLTQTDPALSYAGMNTAGTHDGHTGYVQSYSSWLPPLDYHGSNDTTLWNRAAYMGVGFYFTGVASNKEHNLTDIQVSYAPMAQTAPPAFSAPRQLVPIIKPTRINFVGNPSFELNTGGWAGLGSGTISQDTNNSPAPNFNTLTSVDNLPTYFNNAGISDDGVSGLANFDGSFNTYSQQALTINGLGPGQTGVFQGMEFALSSTPSGQPDNVACAGQVIPVTGVGGAQFLNVIGASTVLGSAQTGNVIISYSDGSTDVVMLGLSHWTLNNSTLPVGYGNQIVAQLLYYNNTQNPASTVNQVNYLFMASLPVNNQKTVRSVQLPNALGIHIYNMALVEYEDQQFGTSSGKVTVTATNDGAYAFVNNLIVGDEYYLSCYLQAGPGLTQINVSCGSGSYALRADEALQQPYGGTTGIGYGQGYYGGSPPATVDIPTGVWYRIGFPFKATSLSGTSFNVIEAIVQTGTDFVNPSNFWIDAVMVEEGEVLNPYFDGSYGSTGYQDYQWEAGGVPHNTRSYYYEQFNVKKYSIQQILDQHTPLGLTYEPPQYLTIFTQ